MTESGATVPATAADSIGAVRPKLGLWLLTSLLAGGLIMGLEMVGFRLYAPYFGYSIYVWGNMIGFIMVALALGYAFGGWLADRSRTDLPLYLAIFLSAVYQLVILATMHRILPALSELGEVTGSIIATLVIFIPSLTALSITSPFLIRLMARVGHIGGTAGQIYALSTVGSVLGIIGSTFWLLPTFGTFLTLQIVCGATGVLGVLGLMTSRRSAALGIVPLAAVGFVPDQRWTLADAQMGVKTVWVAESAYNLVRVVTDEKSRRTELILNNPMTAQSLRFGESEWTGEYFDEFAIGPYLVSGPKALLLGMGGGMTIRATHAARPEIVFDAIEIDPMVVEAAARFFDMKADGQRLRVHVADGRPWLMNDTGTYDIVHSDMYHGGPYVPFYLVTREFYELVKARMAADGVLLVHVLDVGSRREILHATAATLAQVFPSLMMRKQDSGLIYAFKQPRPLDEVRQRIAAIEGPARLRELAAIVARDLVELVPEGAPGALGRDPAHTKVIPRAAPVFTDNDAPVEQMTYRMLAEVRAEARKLARQGRPKRG